MLLDGWHLLSERRTRASPSRRSRLRPADGRRQRIVERLAVGRADGRGVGHGDRRALSCQLTHCSRRHRALPRSHPRGARLPRRRWCFAAGMQDPGNVGAIIRAAEAGGATGVVLDERVGGSVGLESAPRVDGQRLPRAGPRAARSRRCEGGARAGVRIVATAPARRHVDVRGGLAPPTALFLGGEGAGLPALLPRRPTRVSIPMRANRIAERRRRRRLAALRSAAAQVRARADSQMPACSMSLFDDRRRRSIRRPFRSPSGCARERSTRSWARTS